MCLLKNTIVKPSISCVHSAARCKGLFILMKDYKNTERKVIVSIKISIIYNKIIFDLC